MNYGGEDDHDHDCRRPRRSVVRGGDSSSEVDPSKPSPRTDDNEKVKATVFSDASATTTAVIGGGSGPEEVNERRDSSRHPAIKKKRRSSSSSSFLSRYELPTMRGRNSTKTTATTEVMTVDKNSAIDNVEEEPIVMVSEDTPLLRRASNFLMNTTATPRKELTNILYPGDDPVVSTSPRTTNTDKNGSRPNSRRSTLHGQDRRGKGQATPSLSVKSPTVDRGNNKGTKNVEIHDQDSETPPKGWDAVKKRMKDGDLLLEGILHQQQPDDNDPTGISGSRTTNVPTSHPVASNNSDSNTTFFSCTATKNTANVNKVIKTKTTLDSSDNSEQRSTSDQQEEPTIHELRRRAIQQFQENMTFSPKQCLMAIGVYLVFSVMVFCLCLEPEWTIIDSCYFAVTTFTTLGYGDLVPTSVTSQVFTAIYALLGVAVLGLALGILGSNLIESQGDKEWGSNVSREYDALTLFDRDHDDHGNHHDSSDRTTGATAANDTKNIDDSRDHGKTTHRTREDTNDFHRGVESMEDAFSAKRFFVLLGVAISMAFAIGISSGWSTYQTLYYYTITACTIGYGELTPHTQIQRFLAIFFIPLAACVTGYALAYFADRIIEVQSKKAWDSRVALHKELTVDDLRILDIDGDGTVTYVEFLEFMLLTMKKVDPALLEALREYFDKLDVCHNGVLSKDDLIETARRKLQSPRRKLELAEYKTQLLQISKDARLQQEKQNRQEENRNESHENQKTNDHQPPWFLQSQQLITNVGGRLERLRANVRIPLAVPIRQQKKTKEDRNGMNRNDSPDRSSEDAKNFV